MVWSEHLGLGLAKDVCKLMVVLGDCREVQRSRVRLDSMSIDCGQGHGEGVRSGKLAGSSKSTSTDDGDVWSLHGGRDRRIGDGDRSRKRTRWRTRQYWGNKRCGCFRRRIQGLALQIMQRNGKRCGQFASQSTDCSGIASCIQEPMHIRSPTE